MKSKRTDQQLRRCGLSALIAGLSLIGGGQMALAGNGHATHSPQGPLFKTLDLVAGGIETVLQKTVLAGKRQPPACDAPLCDDGCDAVTLHELEMYSLDAPALMPSPHPTFEAPPNPPEEIRRPSVREIGEDESDAPGYWDAPTELSPIEPPVAGPATPPIAGPATPRPAAEPKPTPLETKPASPFGLPQVPAEQSTPLPTAPPESATPEQTAPAEEDEWIESFAPKQPTSRSTPQRFAPERKSPQRSNPPRVDREDAFGDPFRDDPQSRSIPLNAPLKTTRASKPSRSTVKPVGFVRPR
jgi:hypothetical protein